MPVSVPVLLCLSLSCPLGPALTALHPTVAGASPAFGDPLCLHCWAQRPALRKLWWQLREWLSAAQLGKKLLVSALLLQRGCMQQSGGPGHAVRRDRPFPPRAAFGAKWGFVVAATSPGMHWVPTQGMEASCPSPTASQAPWPSFRAAEPSLRPHGFPQGSGAFPLIPVARSPLLWPVSLRKPPHPHACSLHTSKPSLLCVQACATLGAFLIILPFPQHPGWWLFFWEIWK